LRESKYEFLKKKGISSVEWTEIPAVEPNYFFVEKDFEVQEEYLSSINIQELFPVNSVGIVTARDNFTIHEERDDVKKLINDFVNLEAEEARKKYSLGKDVRDWKVHLAQADIRKSNLSEMNISKISYRPFDDRWTYYTGRSKGFHCMPRGNVMQHFIKGENVGISLCKQFKTGSNYYHALISNSIIESSYVSNRTSEITSIFPLYLYPNDDGQESMDEKQGRKPNLNMEIVKEIEEKLGMKFVAEKEPHPNTEETPPNLPKGEALRGYSPSSGGVGEVLPNAGEVSLYQKPGYVTANPATYRYIKVVRDELKANPTKAENILWEYLRNKKTGYKIRRQHIIANFIADFVCLKEKLIIEIDGGIHNEQKEYDVERTKILNGLGYKVVRFSNDDILEDPQKVAHQIKRILEKGLASASQSNEKDIHHDQEIPAKQETPPNTEETPPNTEETPPNTEETPPNTEETPPNLPKGEALRGISPSSGGVGEVDDGISPSSGGVGEVSFAPIDILDYIYAVLHSPKYREKYKEFLKIDFPRVPYPYDVEVFWKLVELGGELRQIHLLESPKVTQYITSYPNDGDNVITRSLTKKSPGFEMTDETTKTGRVWINDQQYFDGVPEVAYNFYIGGYQPAQKWLKDRKGRQLSFEDIMHYQKIIVALTETDRIMKEIDEINIEEEGDS
jgi:very-short-patch-repair endonuclease